MIKITPRRKLKKGGYHEAVIISLIGEGQQLFRSIETRLCDDGKSARCAKRLEKIVAELIVLLEENSELKKRPTVLRTWEEHAQKMSVRRTIEKMGE